jgi:hypothetical protein
MNTSGRGDTAINHVAITCRSYKRGLEKRGWKKTLKFVEPVLHREIRCARISARVVAFLPYQVQESLNHQFAQFTQVNPARFDKRRKAQKSLKPQF